MASVISSSLRKLGLIRLTDSNTSWPNMYTPTSARSLVGSFGFSTSRTTRPPCELRDAEHLRIGHAREQDLRGRLLALELLDEPRDAVLEQVVAQVHHERVVAENDSLISTACARPRGASCSM